MARLALGPVQIVVAGRSELLPQLRGGCLTAEKSFTTCHQIEVDQGQGDALTPLLATPQRAVGAHLRPVQRPLVVGHAIQAPAVGLDFLEP